MKKNKELLMRFSKVSFSAIFFVKSTNEYE